MLPHLETEISVDIGVNKKDFAFDRGGRHHIRANEYVLRTNRLNSNFGESQRRKIDLCSVSDDIDETDCDNNNDDKTDNDNDNNLSIINIPNPNKIHDINKHNYTNKNSTNFAIICSIKVLAYNRVESLQRLFNSLLDADYMGQNVSMEIFIDGAKNDDVRRKNFLFVLYFIVFYFCFYLNFC